MLYNGYPGLLDAPLRSFIHPYIGIDACDLTDVCRIMGKIQSRAKANLQNGSFNLREQLMALFVHDGTIESEIAEEREYEA